MSGSRKAKLSRTLLTEITSLGLGATHVDCLFYAYCYAWNQVGSEMRTLIFFGCIAIGGLAGLLVAAQDAWSVRAVMITIGCVAGAAIGSAIGRVARGAGVRRPEAHDASFGMGSGPDDRDRNYWRDGGHPPFMRPSRSEPDRHMLDPDRVD